MASTNKTELGLSQYIITDIPDMADINNDNQKITAEFEKRPEATEGKYLTAENADLANIAIFAQNAEKDSNLDNTIKDLTTKLDDIEPEAQKNVQADWGQMDTTKDSYIKNKPDIALKSDLSSNQVGKGSSMVGISDIQGNFNATNVEGALAELGKSAKVIKLPILKQRVYCKIATVKKTTSLNHHTELLVSGTGNIANVRPGISLILISGRGNAYIRKFELIQEGSRDVFLGFVEKSEEYDVYLYLSNFDGNATILPLNITLSGVIVYSAIEVFDAMPDGFTETVSEYFYSTIRKPTLDEIGAVSKTDYQSLVARVTALENK